MVWGMAMPESFGKFWPYGDFEGGEWLDRLAEYYVTEMPKEQKVPFETSGFGVRNYRGYVVDKFRNGAAMMAGPGGIPFTPIAPHEPPRSFKITKPVKSLASLIMLNDRLLAVDEHLKALIETLEPNVHGFYPINLVMRNGNLYPKSYFVLVVGQCFDSFSPRMSQEKSWSESEDVPGSYFFIETKKAMAGLAFSEATFGKAHLWREKHFRQRLTSFSNELRLEIDNAGLRIPTLNQMMEV